MVFSSSLFLLYFLPFLLIGYYLSPNKLKNYVLLIASLFFYAWGAPKFVFAIIGSIVFDFILAKQIHASEGIKRKVFLFISVCANLGLLLYFKYSNFFIDNVNEILTGFEIREMHWVEVALPIGISFFTFHELSYIIDVYRRVKPPLNNIADYALYILLFPQLIAGPIIRFNEISDQIQERGKQITVDNCLIGLFRFVIGLSKKVLIANVLGIEADRIFSLPENELTTSLAWVGSLAYTFQIYFDFSGYSDMAIGIARMLGFVFPENFNNPYISQSITEFWRRWHITLSRWMRDYLYIPLGGNRVSPSRLYFNLWIVFLLSGFWHGAQWTFIIWGAYHGFFLVIERLFLLKLTTRIGKVPRIIFTFLIVVISWVFFRADSYTHAILFIKKMFAFEFQKIDKHLFSDFWTMLIIATFISFITLFKFGEKMEKILYGPKINLASSSLLTTISILFLIICVSSITSSGFNPFIYFRF